MPKIKDRTEMASGIVESSGEERERQRREQQQQRQGRRAQMVQRLLAPAPNLPEFLNDLIRTQAVMVAGTEAAGFLVEPSQDGQSFALKPIAHIRPDGSPDEVRQAALNAFQEIIRPCVEQGKDGAVQVSDPSEQGEPQFCLVTLLRSGPGIVAASAVITRARDIERAHQRLQSMQLVAGYFDMYTLRRTSEQSQQIAQNHQHVLQLASAVATADGFTGAAMNLCNELAARTGASRVAIGWVKGRNIKLKALSHTEQFDKKQEMSVQIVKVMEECWDQEEIVQYDPTGESSSNNITREAANLSRIQGGHTIMSLPLRRKGEITGVLTLEFAPTTKLSPQAATGLAVAAELLAPQLADRYDNDRYLITKAGISARELLKKAIGPQFMLAKAIILSLLGLALFMGLYKPMYYVKAPFQFAAIERRAISAPFEGIIKEVHVRPGDVVKAGAPLMSFDTVELQLQYAEALKRAETAAARARAFRADPTKTAEYAIELRTQEAEQAKANLYKSQLDRSVIRAEIDGHILVGDWRDKIGATVKLGEPLFELGDPTGLRADLSVNERDVQDVAEGKRVWLATNSLPSEKFPGTVERVVPLGEGKDGANVFTVKVRLDESNGQWRPGMLGEAKIEVEPRRLAWIWTHRTTEWLSLKWWQWSPFS